LKSSQDTINIQNSVKQDAYPFSPRSGSRANEN
jgi:hypothetical protein